MLNIAGLALGIGCALVIYKVIDYELSFDTHHSNYDNIYRVVRTSVRPDATEHNSGAAHPLGPALREEFPIIKEVAIVDYQSQLQVNISQESGEFTRYLDENGVTFAQTEIFRIFDFEFLAGNPSEALKNPNEVILSVKWMNKFFGFERNEAQLAMGKRINLEGKKELVVVGVYEDFPETTDFPFRMIINYETLEGINRYFGEGKNWHSVSSTTSCLVLLDEKTTPQAIERQLPDFIDKYVGEGTSQFLSLKLQPLSDIHFNEVLYNYSERSINKQVLIALAIIGLVLVVTACINFINLSTAQAVKRSKEIGIRKVMGGFRTQLIIQFLSETFIITFFAVLVSLGVAELLLVNLADILSYQLHLNLFEEPLFLVFLFGLTIFVGFLSGLYPSFLLSRIDAINAIKTKLGSTSTGGFSLRRALVIFQFGMSQLLIICTLIVSSQMELFNSKELGFAKDAIVLAYLPDNHDSKLERLREGLMSNPEVSAVSFNLSAPTGENNSFANFNYVPANIEEDPHANFKIADEHYIDLYEIELIAGRKLKKSDSGAVINRRVVEFMGLDNPEKAIGEPLKSGFGGDNGLEIVGVVEDFHTQSLNDGLDLVIMVNYPSLFFEVAVKFNKTEGSLSNAKEIVEMEWNKVFPANVFDFDFYDKQLAESYEDEQSIAKLLTIFSVIAIFIGCLGLYGLITFMANQKTKEIGVRKVLGASVVDILRIFSKELVLLMIIAFIIAAPVSFFSMDKWLNNFEYRIDISFNIFLIAVLVSFAIALFTMGYRSIKAAFANPSESLKDE